MTIDAPAIDDPAYFARLAAVDSRHWWSSGMWRIAAHWLDREIAGRTGLLALDAGCGAGGTLARLRSRPEIARVAGIDPSRAAVDRACGFPVALGSALALPFASETFDVATCFDVLQHLPPGGDGAALVELHRVLKPGGVVVLRANGRGLWPPATRGTPPYRLATLTRLSADAGFTVRAASYANCLPSVASELAGKLRMGRGSGHPSGGGLRIRPVSPAKGRVMGVVSRVEAHFVGRMGLRLPAGHSTMLLAIKTTEAS